MAAVQVVFNGGAQALACLLDTGQDVDSLVGSTVPFDEFFDIAIIVAVVRVGPPWV